MKKVCILLLFIGTALASHSLLAQTKTPYQKKKEAVTRKFFKGLGLRDVYIDHIIKTGSSDDIRSLPEVRNQMAWLAHSPNGKMRIMALYSEAAEGLAAAEKLKTDVDFKREAEEKRKAEEEKRKAEEKANPEKVRRSYRLSDAYAIRVKIHEEYKQWREKKEFESTSDYNVRMTKTDSALKMIFFNSVYNYQKKENLWLSGSGSCTINFNLGEYNADKGEYPITFSTDRWAKGEYVNVSNYGPWKGKIKIAPKDAQLLKEKFDRGGGVLTDTSCNWTFYNNNLCPVEVSIDGYPVHFEMAKNNGADIFTKESLGIDENSVPYFDLGQYASMCLLKKEEERKREEKKREEERKQKLSVYENGSLESCPTEPGGYSVFKPKSPCRNLVEFSPFFLRNKKIFIESCAGCTGEIFVDIHINEAGEVIGYQPVDTADFNKFKSVLVPQMEALKKVLRFNEIKKRKRSRIDHRRVVFEFRR